MIRAYREKRLVEGCSTVVTEKSASPGGPWSHGGVCTIRAEGKPVRVIMCDSDGVGGFALATCFTATEEGVRHFVLSVCARLTAVTAAG